MAAGHKHLDAQRNEDAQEARVAEGGSMHWHRTLAAEVEVVLPSLPEDKEGTLAAADKALHGREVEVEVQGVDGLVVAYAEREVVRTFASAAAAEGAREDVEVA